MDRACLMDLNLLRTNNNHRRIMDTGSLSSSPTYGGGGGGGHHSGGDSSNSHQSPPSAANTNDNNNNNKRPRSSALLLASGNGRLSRTDSYSSDHSNHTNGGGDQRNSSKNDAGRKLREFTPDERKDNHYWDRRRRNNEAAKRSREKRRMHDVALEQRLMEVINENMFLRAEIQALRDEYLIPLEAPPLVLQKPALLAAAQAAVNHAHHALQQQYHAANSNNSGNTTPVVVNSIMKPAATSAPMFTPLLAAHIGSHLTTATGGASCTPFVNQASAPFSFSLNGFASGPASASLNNNNNIISSNNPATFAVKNFLFPSSNSNSMPACTLSSAIQNNIHALAARLASATSSSSSSSTAQSPLMSIAPPTIPLTSTFTFRTASDNNLQQKQQQIFDFQQAFLQQQPTILSNNNMVGNNHVQIFGSHFDPQANLTAAGSQKLQQAQPQQQGAIVNAAPQQILLKSNTISSESSSSMTLTADDSNDGALSPSTVAVNTLLQFAEGQWGGVPGFVRPAKQIDTTKRGGEPAAATNRDSKSPPNNTNLHATQNKIHSASGENSVSATTSSTQWPLKLRHKERTIRTTQAVTIEEKTQELKAKVVDSRKSAEPCSDDAAPAALENAHSTLAALKERRPSFNCASSKLTKLSSRKQVVVNRAANMRSERGSFKASSAKPKLSKLKITKKLQPARVYSKA